MNFKTLLFFISSLFILLLSACESSSNISTEAYNKYDLDQDGLADKYERALGFDPQIKDADANQNDPLFDFQWHLYNTTKAPSVTTNNLIMGEDINIAPVWRESLGEKNVTLSIVDTGIDSNHPDLDVDRTKSYRYSDGSSDPSPTTIQLYNDNDGSAHGTACAGIAAALGWNGEGIRGVAPNINLAGLNVFSNPTDASFADALLKEGIDVSSNSWGGGGAHFLFDDATSLEAIQSGVKSGRDSKGVVYLFASGNDAANANFQSILASGEVIAISGVDGAGVLEEYSDFGANILVAAPGGSANPNYLPAIVATDLSGTTNGMDTYQSHWQVDGNENGDYTYAMNGTSAACPMVAGVVGVLLSVNPRLNYREIQYILAMSARKNDAADAGWRQNGAQRWINDKYGFGVVDADAALKLAKSFQGFTQTLETNLSQTTVMPIDATHEIDITFDVNESFLVQQAQLEINTNHTNPGKLQIVLLSPSNTVSTLAYGDTVLYDNYDPWTFLSLQMLGESAKGIWHVKIKDLGVNNSGELLSARLKIRGYL